MMKVNLEIGDVVSVNFNNAQLTLSHRAIIKYIPLSQGDSWVFVDTDTGVVHYVSEGCTVSLVESVNND